MKKSVLQKLLTLIFNEVGKRIDARAATLERRLNDLEVKMEKRMDVLETRRAGVIAHDPSPALPDAPTALPGETVDEYAARCAAALITDEVQS